MRNIAPLGSACRKRRGPRSYDWGLASTEHWPRFSVSQSVLSMQSMHSSIHPSIHPSIQHPFYCALLVVAYSTLTVMCPSNLPLYLRSRYH
ncbi:uncharacterized protein BO95DRAFT_275425 [Aspergillus brunneoviolaceus CBS 621.78]|uniref:Uncharacterized protein n=1 Tax=Aspergillus brunneoviolaceus CBS 621.78 TaxID=1450534 RepID=A0ACD1FWC1_9EURO|nr:hypothetical protein BO95DRAFT_275425 [Aspergillus brunneoviolaceus CBS 621.78]RAH41286.1 hypothetical protein BO95DRAFT_275425 [Aspergillus brunneoviolaceus CBS 621.78]